MIILTLMNMQVMGLRLATFRRITPEQVPRCWMGVRALFNRSRIRLVGALSAIS